MTSSPASPSHDDDDELLDVLQRDDTLQDASGVIAAGLLGAALGAGLGWLASRSVRHRSVATHSVAGAERSAARAVRETWHDAVVTPMRDTGRDGVRDTRRGVSRQRTRVHARTSETVDDVVAVARRTAAALERSRADAERQLERGLRDLRRAARRAARRIG